jgi:hypothetical protein
MGSMLMSTCASVVPQLKNEYILSLSNPVKGRAKRKMECNPFESM